MPLDLLVTAPDSPEWYRLSLSHGGCPPILPQGTLCCNNHPCSPLWSAAPLLTVTAHLLPEGTCVLWPLLLQNSLIPSTIGGVGSVTHVPTSALDHDGF